VDVKVTVEHAALDPFRGYANAIRDELPDAVAVLDAFHVVKLAGQALDEVRRRVQQQTLHRRGHKDDPLYKVRRTLLTGDEHLTDRQRERLGRTPRRLSVNCTQADMQDMLTHSAGREPPHRFRCPPQQHRRRRSRNMKHDGEQQQTEHLHRPRARVS
jgi:Transposase